MFLCDNGSRSRPRAIGVNRPYLHVNTTHSLDALTCHLRKRFDNNARGSVDVLGSMGGGKKASLELRWREINAVLETDVKKLCVTRGIAALGGVQIEDRSRRKK